MELAGLTPMCGMFLIRRHNLAEEASCEEKEVPDAQETPPPFQPSVLQLEREVPVTSDYKTSGNYG